MSTVTYSSRNGVGAITLDSQPGNLISTAFMAELQTAVRQAADSDVRAVVVRSQGQDFCSGGHPELFANATSRQIRAIIRSINQTFDSLEQLPVPTIAVVQGNALGGGFELALRCDFIIAADDAHFRFLESDFAVLPLAGGIQRLAARVGSAVVSRLVLLSERVPAATLADLAVLTMVPAASLAHEGAALAERLSHGPTQAYAGTKAILQAWLRGGLSAADEVMIDVATRLFDTKDVASAAVGSTQFIGR